ncbi:MAG: transcriptional repressor [Candidatus Aenigmatarchaeota archaeon]
MKNEENFEKKIKENKMRLTKQRKIILNELRKVKTHPTASQIYEIVKWKIPNISLGTVYRNLRVLKELGMIQEFEGEISRFDGNPKNHKHFVCKNCKNIYDIDIPVRIIFKKDVIKKCGFKIYDYSFVFYGTCKNCRRVGKVLEEMRI